MNPLIPRPILGLAFALALASSAALAQNPPAAGQAAFGLPLPGMTAAESGTFRLGQAAFAVVETPATGLGPIFNDSSCVACHGGPAPGGSSQKTVTRFGLETGGVFDPLTQLDGSLLHARAIAPALRETVPAEANVTAKRLSTPLFGAGLIEAIPDAVIEANARLAQPFGIAGTAAHVTDVATGETRVGRFGWKAQHATLLSFAGDALNNEIGITNRLFPKAAAPDGNEALLARFVSPGAPIEDQPSPATQLSEIDVLAGFMRFLSPPPTHGGGAAAAAGQKLFSSVGCAACHTPTLNTGPNASAALANKAVNLYSDLLLHDMGALGDGIAQGAASTTQMRTAPLWGLSARHLYLHDGRATTPAAAIEAHSGEAAQVVSAYNALTSAQQLQLQAFLNSL